mgnify:CR=1 FL=1
MPPRPCLPELPHSDSLESPSVLGVLAHLDIPSDGTVLPVRGLSSIPPEAVLTACASPSLVSARGAREMKFVVTAAVADQIRDWAQHSLAADPHSGLGTDGYRVNSLYLDTPNFDTFCRRPGFRRRKFRLRRYGSESMIWLEVKRKCNGLVRKRRVSVAETEWTRQVLQTADLDWEGAWFRRRLDQRQLRPVCQVTYCRTAHIGSSVTGPVRLTIDRDVIATTAADWQVSSGPFSGEPLLNSRRIVEFKFRDVLPASFRGLIQDLRLAPSSFSKYRESVAACISLSRLTGECV